MDLEKRRNDAFYTNKYVGGVADIGLTEHGSNLYWAVTAIMLVSTMAFLGMGVGKPLHGRLFHYITAGVVMVAAIAYYSMASHLGWTPIEVEFKRNNPKVRGIVREVFYVRYIDWFITTPLLLLDLLLTAAMPWPTIASVIFVDILMIVVGLVGALTRTSYKWGYFFFGMLALFYIVYELVFRARVHARTRGDDVGRVFFRCGTLTAFLWLLYPIAWGLCEGGNVISLDSEAVFYSILDVLAKPVFGALLLMGHRNIEPARLGINIRGYDDDHAVHGGTTTTTTTTRGPRTSMGSRFKFGKRNKEEVHAPGHHGHTEPTTTV